MTKFDRLVIVMGDGEWHSTEELVERVGHRFSATKHIAEKRGYRFDRRRQGQQFEYRMRVGVKETISRVTQNFLEEPHVDEFVSEH